MGPAQPIQLLLETAGKVRPTETHRLVGAETVSNPDDPLFHEPGDGLLHPGVQTAGGGRRVPFQRPAASGYPQIHGVHVHLDVHLFFLATVFGVESAESEPEPVPGGHSAETARFLAVFPSELAP